MKRFWRWVVVVVVIAHWHKHTEHHWIIRLNVVKMVNFVTYFIAIKKIISRTTEVYLLAFSPQIQKGPPLRNGEPLTGFAITGSCGPLQPQDFLLAESRARKRAVVGIGLGQPGKESLKEHSRMRTSRRKPLQGYFTLYRWVTGMLLGSVSLLCLPAGILR